MENEKRLIDANVVRHKINAFTASVVYRGSDLMITEKDSCNPYEYTRGYEQGALDATNIVTGQPTVDAVEMVHGRWLQEMHGNSNNGTCSVCGSWDHSYAFNWKFCPNCGAKMDK